MSKTSIYNHNKNQIKRSLNFTLVELLIVVAIIAILMSILFPALRKAKDKANQIYCTGNMRQIGTCLNMYYNDADNYIPPFRYEALGTLWMDYLATYLPAEKNKTATNNVFVCPSGVDSIYNSHFSNWVTNYGCNVNIFGDQALNANLKKLNTVRNLSSCSFVCELDNTPYYHILNTDSIDYRHAKGVNVLYGDAHAGWHKYPVPPAANDPFWY